MEKSWKFFYKDYSFFKNKFRVATTVISILNQGSFLLKLIPFPGILCGFVPVISAWSQNLCILLPRRNFKVFICNKFHKLFMYAVLHHRNESAILVLLVSPHFSRLDMAIISAFFFSSFPWGLFRVYKAHMAAFHPLRSDYQHEFCILPEGMRAVR